jgi:outer membrane protein assembly factor BamB
LIGQRRKDNRVKRSAHLARAAFAYCILSLACGGDRALAKDWPQILGPGRDGKAQGESLPTRLNQGAIQVAWQKPVGAGFAGVSVAGNTAIVFHRPGQKLVAEALSADSGKSIWQHEIETNYVSSISPDNGPRAAPVIHDDDVYLYGPDGELSCVELKSGRERWSRRTRTEFVAPEGYFGAGSSPLVEGELLLLNVGGRNGAGIVAFDRKTGTTRWKALDDAASYSSPVPTTLGGRRQVLFVTRLNVVSIDPANGGVLFQIPFGKRGPTVNGANPVIVGDTLLVTASYGIGAQAHRLAKTGTELLWESDETLSSQYVTPIERDGFVYGVHGRQDGPPAALRCVELQTGKVRWSEENFGTAALIMAGDKLLAVKVDGELVIFGANPSAYKPLGSVKLFESTVQALPALSKGRLYVRDEKMLKCVRLSDGK